MLFGWRSPCPWALPKATLNMAVGQLEDACGAWARECCDRHPALHCSLGVAQGYVDYGRWPSRGCVWGMGLSARPQLKRGYDTG